MDLASTNRAIKTVVIKMECSYFIRKFRGTNKYIELIYPLTFIKSDTIYVYRELLQSKLMSVLYRA